MEFPGFWEGIKFRYRLVDAETINTLVCRKELLEYTIRDRGMQLYTVHDKLELLMYSPNLQFIQKLSFSNIALNYRCADCISDIIRLAYTLKEIEFVHCGFPNRKTLQDVLSSLLHNSATTTHISFYKNHSQRNTFINGRNDFVFTPLNKDIPNVTESPTTYLRLAGPDPKYCNQYTPPGNAVPKTGQPLSGAFQKFRNLVHLLLDSHLLVRNNSTILNEAIKYCPQLINLIVTNNAEIPHMMCLYDDRIVKVEKRSSVSINGSDSSTTSNDHIDIKQHQKQKKGGGLQKLILANKNIQLGRDTSTTLFKKVHTTLELLYLQCELTKPNCDKIFRNEIANYEWPNLRELYLSFNILLLDSSKSNIMSTTLYQQYQQSLCNLFTRCHGLEAITINNCNIGKNCQFKVDDVVLRSIALNCPKIRYLRVLDNGCYHTSYGICRFATMGAFHLTDLEINMVREAVLPVVIKIKTLKRLDLRSSTSDTINSKEKVDRYTTNSFYKMLDNMPCSEEGEDDMYSSLTGDLKAVKFLLDTRWQDAPYSYFHKYSQKYTFPI
ncbi:hypothetical protein INT45_002817 [Circinella minor]|uniref:Uncharacterized protein n=1 Tax=Circinella minor TaxID=1195481 RepID=A0A8H7S0C3_9FUNG|nr:hypothetical protein INT45_002817 [Circinella minor]